MPMTLKMKIGKRDPLRGCAQPLRTLRIRSIREWSTSSITMHRIKTMTTNWRCSYEVFQTTSPTPNYAGYSEGHCCHFGHLNPPTLSLITLTSIIISNSRSCTLAINSHWTWLWKWARSPSNCRIGSNAARFKKNIRRMDHGSSFRAEGRT